MVLPYLLSRILLVVGFDDLATRGFRHVLLKVFGVCRGIMALHNTESSRTQIKSVFMFRNSFYSVKCSVKSGKNRKPPEQSTLRVFEHPHRRKTLRQSNTLQLMIRGFPNFHQLMFTPVSSRYPIAVERRFFPASNAVLPERKTAVDVVLPW
jgi:hypothetical protein